jgi:rhamnosyltransferase subunit B
VKVLLATLGSLGDLHPFIALARALKAAGCDPLIATIPDYRERVCAAGIRFCASGPSSDERLADLGMGREEFARHILADSDFIFRRAVYPHLRSSYESVLPAVAEAALVLTSSLSFAAQLAAEKLGRPRIGIVLQPTMFLSAYDPPFIGEFGWFAPVLTRLGPRAAGAVLRAVKSVLARRAAPIHRLRAELGLAPLKRDPIFDGQFTHEGAIALYSDLLGAVQPDYPQPTTLAGFAFYDGDAAGGLDCDAGLREFLRSGPAPIVFTLGSFATEAPGDFFEASAAATRSLGRRAVMLVGEGGTDSHRGRDIIVRRYAPYSALFPFAEAIVHHGGIGTTAQALRAGKPQLIVPIFADQPDNAARVVRLHVARSLNWSRYRSRSVAAELTQLLDDGVASRRAYEVAQELTREDGAARAASVVLERLERGSSGGRFRDSGQT